MEVNVDYEYEGNCGTGMDSGYRGKILVNGCGEVK